MLHFSLERALHYAHLAVVAGGVDAFVIGTELRDALANVGEHRFPHVRHHFDERQLTAKSA